MGMYDTIYGKCPECGEENGFQTKSGECLLYSYEIEKAPIGAMYDANRHTPQPCKNCNKLLFVDIENRKLRLATDYEIKDKKERIAEQMKWLKSFNKSEKLK